MTTPTPDRWTAETEALTEAGIHLGSKQCVFGLDECLAEGAHRREARAALEGLTNAGVLLPPGGETAIELAGYRRGWIERDHAMVVGRCWSCDHEMAMHHDPEGCRYSVTEARLDANTVCPCTEFPRREVTDDPA